MAGEIKAGIQLNLKDLFSPGVKKAGRSLNEFRDKAVEAAGKVDGAFSGLAGTIGSLGVGLGAAALVKGSIDFQDAVVRIGTNAGVYGREAQAFGRRLLDVAYDAKTSGDDLLAFAAAASESAIGLGDIEKNLPFFADVIKGVGLSGQEAGELFATLFKRGLDGGEIEKTLDNLAEISDRRGNVSLAEFGRYLPTLMEGLDGSADSIESMYANVNTLGLSTVNGKQAILQFQQALNDLSKTDTQNAIRFATGRNIREMGFAEIMQTLSDFDDAHGGRAGDVFDQAFHLSASTVRTWRQFASHSQDTADAVGELGDTSGGIAKRADENAKTLASSIQNLKTASTQFANSTLIKPVQFLAYLLNSHPDGMRVAVYGLGIALTALAGMKTFTTVKNFAKLFRGSKGGGLPGTGGLTGGAPLPVYVTNMGVFGGGPGAGRGRRTGPTARANGSRRARTPGTRATPRGNAAPMSAPAPAARPPAVRTPPLRGVGLGGGVMGAAFAAFEKVPAMIEELREIKEDDTLSDKERGTAKGGAIGDAVGGIAGAVGGGILGTVITSAIIGAAAGTAVPILGNAAGLIIGGAVGLGGYALGSYLGRKAGGAIGGATADSASPVAAGNYLAGGPHGVGMMPSYAPGRRVNDLIVTPSGNFSTHPDDYIMAMKNPAALRPEVAQVGGAARPAVQVEGEIVLRSELVIDDKGYRVKHAIEKNTTPYKFAVGTAQEARAIQ